MAKPFMLDCNKGMRAPHQKRFQLFFATKADAEGYVSGNVEMEGKLTDATPQAKACDVLEKGARKQGFAIQSTFDGKHKAKVMKAITRYGLREVDLKCTRKTGRGRGPGKCNLLAAGNLTGAQLQRVLAGFKRASKSPALAVPASVRFIDPK